MTDLQTLPPTPAVEPQQQLTAEQLVAKCIAPVKKEYLRSPPQRPTSTPTQVPEGADGGVEKNGEENSDDVKEKRGGGYSSVVTDKKSKRQAKRDRQQERKSALHICPEVAKASNINACRYGANCRFSHDIEAYQAQKPADFEGDCPFLIYEGPCPYGLACRFSGTHKVDIDMKASNDQKKSSEINRLSKDVQKLLWKNKMKFPKANSQLKLLGLSDKSKIKKSEVDEEEADVVVSNGSHPACENTEGETVCHSLNGSKGFLEVPMEEGLVTDSTVNDDLRPPKKAKSLVDENNSLGSSSVEKDSEESGIHAKLEKPQATFRSETDVSLKLHPREKKLIDFRGKMYLAPLTTVGNLPFRRLCKVLGADITCGEMAMCTNLLQGEASEWALLRRHSSENVFGIQICGAYPDTVARAVELIDRECEFDFIDINMGCPIDLVVNKGAGSALLTKPMRIRNVIQAASGTVDKPITVKVRTGYFEGRNRVDSLITDISNWGASAVTIHGRSRQQRYSKLADWDYINQCATKAPDELQVLGNGDVYSYLDWNQHMLDCPKLAACMIARGSLIKPWIFTEIKEQKHWDITSGERLNILKDYVQFGLEHWGSDTKGIDTTRHFLLEWLSYMYRYVPVGLLDVIPSKLNWRSPTYVGRDDLETLMASNSAADWIRITELLLGKVPDNFTFAPKHKSNAYDKAENG